MTDLATMTDEELKREMEIRWSRYMYYQAAEGNWRSEEAARGVATKEYYDCITEMKNRGLEVS